MKEHGIIMQPYSVRAILDGRKTQTRRLIRKRDRKQLKFVGRPGDDQDDPANWGYTETVRKTTTVRVLRHPISGARKNTVSIEPPFAIGDHLWVREMFQQPYARGDGNNGCIYVADGPDYQLSPSTRTHSWSHEMKGWRSPLLMPRWASRLSLEIVRVRVERLQRITPEDVVAEAVPGMVAGRYQCSWCNGRGRNITYPNGCPVCHGTGVTPLLYFRDGWNAINAKRQVGEQAHSTWESNPFVYVYEFRRVEADAIARSA